MAKISHSTDLMLDLFDCYSCGVPFAMPAKLADRYRDTKDSFYCPNGHGQLFTKTTKHLLDEEKAKRAKDQEAHQRQIYLYRERAESAERSNTSLRGQITKLRNQLSAGGS